MLIFISINTICYSKKHYILHKEEYRNFANILKTNNPEYKNVFFLTQHQMKYYIDLTKCDKYFIDNLWQDFNKSKIPEKLKILPKADYWLECGHATSYSLNAKLKEYICNDPHLKVLDIWAAPYNENVYLIHFKKIKDYE